jgi:putative ABC transport system substrate-binding protein
LRAFASRTIFMERRANLRKSLSQAGVASSSPVVRLPKGDPTSRRPLGLEVPATLLAPRRWGDRVKRREFIMLLGGAAAAWPLAARAQQGDGVRRVGALSTLAESDLEVQSWIRELVQRLQELGWTNGRNVQVDFRFSDADAARTSMLAAELIELRPDVVLASGALAATALRQQTLSIPIVFVHVVDPVSAGFVTNLARPEGNITGFTNFEFSVGEKWLQLLKECAPSVDRIAVVFDPANPTWAAYLRTIEAAAPSFGVRLIPTGVRDAAEITQRVATFARYPNGALVVLPSPVTIRHRETIIVAAARHRLPTIYPYRFFTVDGGLMSYASDVLDSYRRAASYVDRILRGAKIAELPVQQPIKYELTINVQTAKTLGLALPDSVLARADEVIE